MATRSNIAYMTEEGKIKSVYCHWDGYPEHNGEMLRRYYTDQAKIRALIALGSLSSLRPEIGEKHSFDKNYDQPELSQMFDNWTLAYNRDRGEDWAHTAPSTWDNAVDYVEFMEEYAYLWNGEDWLVHKAGNTDAKGYPIFDFVEVAQSKEVMANMGWDD